VAPPVKPAPLPVTIQTKPESWADRLARWMGWLKSILANAALVIAIPVVAILFGDELLTHRISIGAIEVPPALVQRGLAPKALASKAADRLNDIRRALTDPGRRVLPPPDAARAIDLLATRTTVDLPVGPISALQLIRMVKDTLGFPDQIIQGEVVETAEGLYRLTLRINDPAREAVRLDLPKTDVDQLPAMIARGVLQLSNPITLAAWGFEEDVAASGTETPPRYDFSRTRAFIDLCLRVAPRDDDPWALMFRGAIRYYEGRPHEAVRIYEEIDRRHRAAGNLREPALASLYRNWGDALRELGAWAEAERVYARAIEVNPRVAGYRIDRAVALMRQGKAPAAVPVLQEALGVDGGDMWTYIHLAEALHLAGRPLEAMEMRAQAMRRGYDPEVHIH